MPGPILRSSLALVSEVVVSPTTVAIIAVLSRLWSSGDEDGNRVSRFIVLSANATAAPAEYAVDGLTIGTKLNFDSASYRAYIM